MNTKFLFIIYSYIYIHHNISGFNFSPNNSYNQCLQRLPFSPRFGWFDKFWDLGFLYFLKSQDSSEIRSYPCNRTVIIYSGTCYNGHRRRFLGGQGGKSPPPISSEGGREYLFAPPPPPNPNIFVQWSTNIFKLYKTKNEAL